MVKQKLTDNYGFTELARLKGISHCLTYDCDPL